MEVESISNIGETSDQNEDGKQYNFKPDKKFFRIEYPGLIQNVDKAIDTLGGIRDVELASSGMRNLELHFHPMNKYNKPCIADEDKNTGILIHIKTAPGASIDTQVDYDVIGVTELNYKFNRLCDFQYLPIVSEKKDCDEGETIYEKIVPKKLPTLDWFASKEISEQCRIYMPQIFSRFDASNYTLHLNSGEKFNLFNNTIKTESTENKNPRRVQTSTKKLSALLNITDPNVKVPEAPLEILLTIVERRGLLNSYNGLKKMFNERPIWTKAAIQHQLKITMDNTKVLLPSVAYYCTMGPWRTCWIKYGYNPVKDFNSRIYQTLDFRIRTSDGVSIKVLPKRASMRHKFQSKYNTSVLDERSFTLRPDMVPPARQMFYQYCDIHLPEIEDMLQRLPKIPTNMKFDPKNGWLPSNFTEQCREIVNKYILEAVQSEILQDNLKQEQSEQLEDSSTQEVLEENEPVSYCSKMLNNIKKGIYKSVNILPMGEGSRTLEKEGNSRLVDTVDLIEEATQDNMDINSEIPDIISEPSDDELNEGSDLEIDLEAVDQINEIIQSAKKEFNPS